MYNHTRSDETVTVGLTNNQLTGEIPRELLKFPSLVLNVAGNKITGFQSDFCDDNDNDANSDLYGWMNGLVELYGCDAIACPVGYYSETGKQVEKNATCAPCASGMYMGATTCDDVVVVEDADDELEILVEFYLALGGQQWDEVKGWEAFKDMESAMDLTLPSYVDEKIDACGGKFYGVVCDQDGKISEVSLPNNGLEGMVPSSFWNLPNLREIDFSGNEIRLDREYGFGDIGKAKSLTKVDLSSNDIQTFKGIGKATSLKELVVDDAYFFSSLDAELYQLTELKILVSCLQLWRSIAGHDTLMEMPSQCCHVGLS